MSTSTLQRQGSESSRQRVRPRGIGISDDLVEGALSAIREVTDRLPIDVPAELSLPIALDRIGMEVGKQSLESVMRDTVEAKLGNAISAWLALDRNASIPRIRAVARIVSPTRQVELDAQRMRIDIAKKIMDIRIVIWQERQLAKNRPVASRTEA